MVEKLDNGTSIIENRIIKNLKICIIYKFTVFSGGG